MNPLVFAALSFLVVASAAVLLGVVALQFWPALRRDRLSAQGMASASPTGSILRFEEATPSPLQRALQRIGRLAEPKDLGKRSKYRQKLAWAGYHDPRALAYFMGAKVGVALVGLVAYPLLGILQNDVQDNVASVSLISFVVGFFLPDIWLRSRIKARQRDIVNSLPDVLDLLMVCVEAGMGFDAAVARVSEQSDLKRSPLHDEMLRMHLEMRAGRPREEALRALGERAGVSEVKAMVAAFIQTDRLGTPLGRTLRVHSESARIERRHRAEERAYLAPLKMIFPTVFFLMPAFFLVAMAPSVLGLVRAFKTLSQ